MSSECLRSSIHKCCNGLKCESVVKCMDKVTQRRRAMEAIVRSSLFTQIVPSSGVSFRTKAGNVHIPTCFKPCKVFQISANNDTSYQRKALFFKNHAIAKRSASKATPYAEGRSLSEAAPTALRVPFQLNEGQFRIFHYLPSGMKMEVIVQKAVNNGLDENQAKKSPIVFVHGSFHAAWCWAVHWLPFFANCGHDCYAVSLLGQGESDVPSERVAGSLQTHARDIAHFIRHEVSIPPVLVGHSYGGLIVQLYLSNLSTNFNMPIGNDEGCEEPYPNLAAAALVCSVPPTGNSGLVWRYLLAKPIAAIKVTLSLAAKAFLISLSLCRETFFSKDMLDNEVERYQELLKHSSSVALFDLRELNASLPVPPPSEYAPPILVIGASDDFIVDGQGSSETAEFYKVSPVIVKGIAHDMMLDISWEKGARAMLSWLDRICS